MPSPIDFMPKNPEEQLILTIGYAVLLAALVALSLWDYCRFNPKIFWRKFPTTAMNAPRTIREMWNDFTEGDDY